MKISLTSNGKDCLMSEFRVGQFFSLLSGLPGRKKWIDRTLVFQPTGANIAFILEHLAEAEWDEGAGKFRDNYIALKQIEENTRQEKADLLVDKSGYEFRTVPFAHQLQAFLLSRDRQTFALFHEQGCGKTKVILDTAAYLWERGEINSLIVVAKNGVHTNWVVEEIPEHFPERIPSVAVFYRNEWRKLEYDNMMKSATGSSRVLRILTFHIEGINAPRAQALLLEWLSNTRAFFVIDESSTIKNASADRTKFLIKAGKLARYRRIMTGTPVTRGIENYYSQFLFLDPKILGYESFYTFRAKFCIMGGFENRQIVAYKNVAELIKIVDGHSHRVLKKDCLDLPPKIYRRRPFDLPPAHRKLYDALRKSAIAEIQAILGEERGLKLAQDVSIVRALRLQQVACGLAPTENPERLDGPQPRIEALMDEIEEAEAGGSKVIVWVRFKHDLRDIGTKLGKKAVQYWGEIKQDDRIAAVKRFQNEDKITVFLASSAAAYGLTLTAANNSIYHSQTTSLDIRLQSEDRNHRIGTRGESVVYTDLEALRTVDRKIINALRKHKSLADQMNQDPTSIFMEEEEEEEK